MLRVGLFQRASINRDAEFKFPDKLKALLDRQIVATTRSERATRFSCQSQTSFLSREPPRVGRGILQTLQGKRKRLIKHKQV